VQGSFAAVSMLGSMIIILTFAFVPTLRKHPTVLILHLSFANFFYSAKFALTAAIPGSAKLQEEKWVCLSQGIFAQV
jgi:hypothetical protein